MSVNLVPRGSLPIAHNFTIFSHWMDEAMRHGYQVLQDDYRNDTFLAIDNDTNVCGMFLMTHHVWGGFVFETYSDRVLFEAGALT